MLWKFKSRGTVWSLSHVLLFATPWTATHQASLSITSLEFAVVVVVVVVILNHLVQSLPFNRCV